MSINSALKKLIEIERAFVEGTKEISEAEARTLVDFFYQFQESRKASANQVRALEASGEMHSVIYAVNRYTSALEELVKDRLEPFVLSTLPGRWMMHQDGIGPVLAANFLAHLDITRSRTAGGFWRFAGYDPTAEWKKGEKRPHNARLKTACWKATDSWVKLGNREDAFYAQVYRQRKALEVERNDRGEFADQAALKLERFKIGKSTDAFKHYSEGRLPPAHVDARARRYAAKLFLAHLHHVMHLDHYGEPPPRPYVIEHGGHAHHILPPGLEAVTATSTENTA